MSPSDDKPVRADGTPRRTGAARWLRPAGIGVAALVLVLVPWWGPMLLRQLSFFQVRHVEIVGVRYVQPRDVLDRLRVDTLASVWDPAEPLERRVAEHPLVRDVRVGRKLPGTLVVTLVEHAPVALVSGPAGFRAYDERGVALPIDVTGADVNAPILSRPDTALLRLLAQARMDAPDLYGRLSEVRRTAGAAETGGEVLFVLDSLPVRTLPDITLQRLADVELVERDLARRRLRAVELDLRFRDQVIARLP